MSLCSTIGNGLSDISHYIIQRHILCFNFLRNNTDIRLYLQSTFQSNMRSRTAHQFDEVPVLTCRVTVTLDVTDYFRIGLTSCIKSERGLDHFVLQVTVDSFRTTDNLHTAILGSIVLGQHAGICIRVVTTNNNQRLDVQFFQNFQTFFKLVFFFQLSTA